MTGFLQKLSSVAASLMPSKPTLVRYWYFIIASVVCTSLVEAAVITQYEFYSDCIHIAFCLLLRHTDTCTHVHTHTQTLIWLKMLSKVRFSIALFNIMIFYFISHSKYGPFIDLSTFCYCIQKHHNHFISCREYCPFTGLSTFRYCIQKHHNHFISRRESCPFTDLSIFPYCLQKQHHNHFISCREYFPFVDLSTFRYCLQKQHHDHFISCREYCLFNDLSTFCHCLQEQLSIVCCICDT